MRQEVEYLKNELTECVTMDMMKNFALISGYAAVLLFSFACGVQTAPSLLTSTTTGTADTIKKINDSVPFAYDLAIDTISYNSCVGIGLNSNGAIHGFKIGANEGFVDTNGTGAVKGGLKLRSEFLQYLAKNLAPNFPNTTIVPSQISYILQSSSSNMASSALPQLFVQYAVRTAADLNVVPDIIQSGPTSQIQATRDGIYERSSMTDDAVLAAITKNVKFGPGGTVLSEGPRAYNVGTLASPKAFEAALGYSSIADDSFPAVATADEGLGVAEQYSDNVRAKFNSSSYVLAVTYGNSSVAASADITTGVSFGLNGPKRKANSGPSHAYGRSYSLSFISKNPAKSSQRKNVLKTVVEKNLEDGIQAAGVSWSCDNVVIMKTSEWNNKKANLPACSELTASDLTDPVVKAKVANLRRHYADSQWGIGLFYDRNTPYSVIGRSGRQLCLVNKSTDCYLPTVGIVVSAPSEDVGVEYNYANDCYLTRYRNMGVSYVGGLQGDDARRLRRCPQYASICVRTSTSY